MPPESTDRSLRSRVFEALIDGDFSAEDPGLQQRSDPWSTETRRASLYQAWMKHATPRERLSLVGEVNLRLDAERRLSSGLFAVLSTETDIDVGAAAAMGIALLTPCESTNRLAGPELVLRLACQSGLSATPRVAALSGVLLLGDHRVTHLLRQPYRQLSSEERRELSYAHGGTIWAAIVDFWIGCLEDEPEEKWARAAWALYDIPRRGNRVLDVQRQFPSYEVTADGKSLVIIREWSLQEFSQEISGRLQALAGKETRDRILPMVLNAWRIE